MMKGGSERMLGVLRNLSSQVHRFSLSFCSQVNDPVVLLKHPAHPSVLLYYPVAPDTFSLGLYSLPRNPILHQTLILPLAFSTLDLATTLLSAQGSTNCFYSPSSIYHEIKH